MTNIANIIQKTSSLITFQVHDVKINERPLLKRSLGEWKYNHLIASSHSNNFESINIQFGRNIFARTIHKAYDSNYPLLLTPDIIWMVIAQGFTQHINNQPTLRHKFIDRQDKASLKVQEITKYNAQKGREIVSQWGLKIEENIDPKLYQLMLCDFTTTTDTVCTTSRVVMTKTYQQYSNYRLMRFPPNYLDTQGIPTITLSGTVDDWKTIRDRVKILAQYDLKWWTDELLPICEEFIATVEGNPNSEFWQQIYKLKALHPRLYRGTKKAYDNGSITGWLAYLFPYLRDSLTGENTKISELSSVEASEIAAKDGIYIGKLPASYSEATVRLREEEETKKLELTVGFIGIIQDNNNCLKPEIGWRLKKRDNLSELIDVLAGQDATELYPDWSQLNCLSAIPQSHFFSSKVPRVIIQLSKKLSGVNIYSETEHSWYFKTPQEYKVYRLGRSKTVFTSFINLNDERCLAYGFVQQWRDARFWDELWIVVGKTKIEKCNDELLNENNKMLILEEAKVIAKGINQLIERIVTAEGRYYFNDPNFVPDDSLDFV